MHEVLNVDNTIADNLSRTHARGFGILAPALPAVGAVPPPSELPLPTGPMDLAALAVMLGCGAQGIDPIQWMLNLVTGKAISPDELHAVSTAGLRLATETLVLLGLVHRRADGAFVVPDVERLCAWAKAQQ